MHLVDSNATGSQRRVLNSKKSKDSRETSERKHDIGYLAFADLFRQFGFDVTKFGLESKITETIIPPETEETVTKEKKASPPASPALKPVAKTNPVPISSTAPVTTSTTASTSESMVDRLRRLGSTPTNAAATSQAPSTLADGARVSTTEKSVPSSTAIPQGKLLPPRALTISIFDKLLADAHRLNLTKFDENLKKSGSSSSASTTSTGDARMAFLRERINSVIKYEDENPDLPLFPEGAFKVSSTSAPYNYRGVVNRRGVDCYVNAILQALLVCSPLMKLLSHAGPGSTSRPILSSLIRFSQEFFATSKNNTSVLNPQQSLAEMDEAWRQFSNDDEGNQQQQDASEFMMWLLENLHQETCWKAGDIVNGKRELKMSDGFVPIQKSHSAADVSYDEDSAIYRIFSLVTRSRFTTNDGTVQSPKDEIISIFPLGFNETTESLTDAFENFFAVENLESGTMTRSISRLPLVLICSIKRSTYENGQHKKIDRFLRYPSVFSVKESLLAEHGLDTEDEAACRDYDLIAVVGHHGKGADEGHYNTFVRKTPLSADRDEEQVWMAVDDANVRSMKDEEWMKCSGAYLLFYMRRDAGLDVRPTASALVFDFTHKKGGSS